MSRRSLYTETEPLLTVSTSARRLVGSFQGHEMGTRPGP